MMRQSERIFRHAGRRRHLCSALTRPAAVAPLPPVPRHGSSDGVVHLNVGGKPFVTLRSTVQRSPVIARALERAESQASLRLGEAVFIDRDPEHFSTLLNHMRVSAERGSNSRATYFFSEDALPLPKEVPKLRALYVEASHFGLEELARRLCSMSFLAKLTQKLHMCVQQQNPSS